MDEIKIEMLKLDDVIPYENNPRINDEAVPYVAESIRQFGFKVPIVIDRDGVIIAGHTRLKAAKSLGMTKVPCIRASDLTEEQVKAFRLADNKVGELAEWDLDSLNIEINGIEDIDMSSFGFDEIGRDAEWFTREDREFDDYEGESDEYAEFVEKFKPKKTTDDCYTPDLIYDVIAAWVENRYKISRSNFVRPFYPDGDYEREAYKSTDIVVDNPPFSILSEIVNFYISKGIKFFLFAPALTTFHYIGKCSVVCANGSITYENGANVLTNFLTNLEDPSVVVRSAPDLYQAIKKADDEIKKQNKKELNKNEYPFEVLTAAMVNKYAKHSVDFEVKTVDCLKISALDAQKEVGQAIYGNGLLLSERAAAERAAAEKWSLSEREMAIVKSLGGEEYAKEDTARTGE